MSIYVFAHVLNSHSIRSSCARLKTITKIQMHNNKKENKNFSASIGHCRRDFLQQTFRERVKSKQKQQTTKAQKGAK